uniref:Uncharacterized protein n=1 Tax=Cacopsylla melanoneura TaxID=428564 RepID=A0A8D8Z8T2_9HEMI
MEALEPNQVEILKSGFRKCSIYPIDVQELLKNFKIRESYNVGEIEDRFKTFLDDKTKNMFGVSKNIRRKKLKVAPGKSITSCDLVNNDEMANEEDVDDVEMVIPNEEPEATQSAETIQTTATTSNASQTTATMSISVTLYPTIATVSDTAAVSDTATVSDTTGATVDINPFVKSPKKMTQKKRTLLETCKPITKRVQKKLVPYLQQ